MSAKINLLPDVKQAKVRESSRRRTAVALAALVCFICVGILALTFVIVQGQNLRIAQLTNSIKDKKTEIAAYPDVNNMLSIQARLDALPALYNQRVLMTKLVEILRSEEPNDVAFNTLSVDNDAVTINALGKSYMASARLARSMEVSRVSDKPTFSIVTLSSVSLTNGQTQYSITATVNPEATSGQ